LNIEAQGNGALQLRQYMPGFKEMALEGRELA
jgi:hypothetical protein